MPGLGWDLFCFFFLYNPEWIHRQQTWAASDAQSRGVHQGRAGGWRVCLPAPDLSKVLGRPAPFGNLLLLLFRMGSKVVGEIGQQGGHLPSMQVTRVRAQAPLRVPVLTRSDIYFWWRV